MAIQNDIQAAGDLDPGRMQTQQGFGGRVDVDQAAVRLVQADAFVDAR